MYNVVTFRMRHITASEQFARFGIPLFTHRFYVAEPIAEHTHDFDELVVITDGEADHLIDGVSYPVSQGDVYLLMGNLHHCFRRPRRLEVINIMFDFGDLGIDIDDLIAVNGFRTVFDLEPGARQLHNFSSHLRLDPEQLRYLEHLHSDLATELEHVASHGTYIVRALLVHILVFLSRCYESVPRLRHQSLTSLSKVLTHIETNFCRRLTLDELSEVAHMSKSTLMRRFRSIMGETPLGYLKECRLERARELLDHTELSISQIADRTGFGSINYLCRCFKASTGMTPRGYRGRRTAVDARSDESIGRANAPAVANVRTVLSAPR